MPRVAPSAAYQVEGDRSSPLLFLDWGDVLLHSKQRKRRRAFRNGRHYWTRQGRWQTSSPEARTASGPPDDWDGGYDFSVASTAAPLQSFARDATDVGNRAMVGIRPSAHPQGWVNLKALDVVTSGGVSVDADVSDDGSEIRYEGLWPGCDLVYRVYGNKLKAWVIVRDKDLAPESFRWTIQHHPSHSIEIENNSMRLLDGDGATVLRTPQPWGRDNSTTANTPSGRQYLRCTLTEEAAVGGRRVVCLKPHAGDLAGAVGDAEYDPTIVISGAASIEDTYLREFLPTNNFGGHTRVFASTASGDDFNALLRLNSSALPAAVSYDSLDFTPSIFSLATGAVDMYVVVPANAWVQGTSVAANEPGAADYDDAKSGTLAWAGGSNGCSVATTDRGTVSQGTILFPGPTPVNTAPLAGWKATPADNNGWVILSTSGSSTRWDSVEGTVPPTFTLEYTEPSGTLLMALSMQRRR